MIQLTRIFIPIVFLFIFLTTFSQKQSSLAVKQNRWQHLDISSDSVYGISMDKAYKELLTSRKNKKIIVAVIDAGIDTMHEDLKSVLWHNLKEKGSDEDGNGYNNDRNGWNFLGVKKGNAPVKPGMEFQRVYLSLKDKCGQSSDSDILKSGVQDCIVWLSTKKQFQKDSAQLVSSNIAHWQQIASEDSFWRKKLGKELYVVKDLKELEQREGKDKKHQFVMDFLQKDSTRTNQYLLGCLEEARIKMLKTYSQDPATHRAETIGDEYNNFDDRFYGDSDIKGNSDHGTHVAGIIAAVRNNGKGIDGLADAVNIMVIRAVFAGADEYDKDVALAIRYAVDNGAKVINMSFGKPYSPQQKWVEEAIQYAAKKDVLIIHAAGNDARNTDSGAFYPTSQKLNGKHFSNMITVGASAANSKELIASFSNYGKQSVDVFAPGVNLYSATFEQNDFKYDIVNGTSIAAPVVSALAAVLRSYFPQLSAKQVKYIIEASVTKIDFPVTRPRSKEKVAMQTLCKTGGIVNAYEAIKLASTLSKKKLRKMVR